MKTLENILRENKEASNIMLARAETEIKYLEQAKLGEAFSCLVAVLGELKKRDIFFYLNGAINMSAPAYCAGLISVEVAEKDYFFSRFVNPYSNRSLGVQFLSVVVEMDPANVEIATEMSSDACGKYEMQDTLFVINTTIKTKVNDVYELARRDNKSVLEITFLPSKEVARYALLTQDVKTISQKPDEELYRYIMTRPISVFDDGGKYLRVIKEIKPKNIDDIALALTLCDCDRTDELENIRNYRQYGQFSYESLTDKILEDSYGTLVYQEQAMEMLCLLSGCSQFHADNIRLSLSKRSAKAKEYKKEFLYGSVDVTGSSFCGCEGNDIENLGEIDGENCWEEIYKGMPKLYLKAHALARAKFFINSAIMQRSKDMCDKRGYTVCDFTIVGGGLNCIYYKGENIRNIEPTIIEIAAVKIVGGRIVDIYNTYVGIAEYDPEFLDFDLTPEFRGVVPMRLLGAPTLENALKKLSEFIQDTTLILRADLPYEALETLKKCGERFGIKFNNKVLRIESIVQVAEVLRECRNLGDTNIMEIASKMREPCEWKTIFDEYLVAFGRDDCLGYALAFAELIIQLDMTIDLWT